MAYIGRQNESGAYIKLDSIASQFDGTKITFDLTVGGSAFYSQNPYSLLVSLDGVIQEPVTSYIIVENQITFAGAPAAGSAMRFQRRHQQVIDYVFDPSQDNFIRKVKK